MIYEFYCRSCEVSKEVVRFAAQCSDVETCTICDRPMARVFTPIMFSVEKGEYNYGLGRYVGKKQDVKDALKQHKDTTGCELIEVGNDNIKPKTTVYDYSNEVRQAHQILKE
jgi:hypothetical protein